MHMHCAGNCVTDPPGFLLILGGRPAVGLQPMQGLSVQTLFNVPTKSWHPRYQCGSITLRWKLYQPVRLIDANWWSLAHVHLAGVKILEVQLNVSARYPHHGQ